MAGTGGPLLYEVATRPWLARLSKREGRRVTLGNVPDRDLAALAERGFDYLWPMGVWHTGSEAARIAREQPWLVERWREAFPDVATPELVASPFAVAEYVVDEELGGNEGLDRLRRRLGKIGVGLVLDFVPHHTAIDAPWVSEHPDWYVAGSDAQRGAEPTGYLAVPIPGTSRWIAHGRDPYFPPWSDTVALDYRDPAVHEAMTRVLLEIAGRCDGVRADMAMLVLADVFRSTWADRSEPPPGDGATGEFWAAAIAAVRRDHPDFRFIAEAYWDLEWRLQQLGFDYTYDKTFYDRLVTGDGLALAAHLRADVTFQRRSVRFLENHDEPRAAAALPPVCQRAGAVLAATVPGMFLVHDGQLDGARIRSPVQFARRPEEPADPGIQSFYGRLLDVLRETALRRGSSLRLEPVQAWPGNPTHEAFAAQLWVAPDDTPYVAVVNLGATQGQCRLSVPLQRPGGAAVKLTDLLGAARYERSREELRDPGLFLDLPSGGVHLFAVHG